MDQNYTLQVIKEMIFLGERIDSTTALNFGLINRIFPAKSLATETTKIAESLAEKSPVAIQAAKAALSRTPLPENSFEINYEALALSTCFATPEVEQTLQALQNRNESWKLQHYLQSPPREPLGYK